MSFTALVTLGLSGISVFADVAGLRLLLGSLVLAVAFIIAIAFVVLVRAATDWAIPGWATSAAGIGLLAVLQIVVLSFVFVFVTLQGRNVSTFIPIRDYHHFVYHVRSILHA